MLDWLRTKTNPHRQDFGTFNFHVKSEPQLIDSSTTLTLTAYSSLFQTATIPCVYRWCTIKNGFRHERPQFRGCSFRCQPSDVGAVVQAQVISTDPEYHGTAVIHFGPVKLDTSLRKHIQSALNAGSSVASAYVVLGNEQRECQIRLEEDCAKIHHIYSDTSFLFDYSLNEPTIQLMNHDRNRIIIRFGEKHQKQLKSFIQKLFPKSSNFSNISNLLELKFPNHSARDTFIFVWKGLITKRQLRLAMVFQKLESFDFGKSETLDYVMEIEGLKSDLKRMNQMLKKDHAQKLQQVSEIAKLKQQMQQLISTYTQIIEQKSVCDLSMSHDSSFHSATNNNPPPHRFKHLQTQNLHLNTRIHALTNQIDAIRFQPYKINYQSPRVSAEIKMDNIKSPFSKKKTQDDSQNFVSMLEDLSSSRISYISEIRSTKEDFELKNRLQQSEQERDQLQRKLQMSFQKIEKLEKELKFNRSLAITPTNSSFNFQQHQRQQQLKNENTLLKETNNSLLIQNRELQLQLNKSYQLIDEQKSFSMMSQKERDLDSSFVSQKTQKKEPIFMEQQDKELLALLMKKENQISNLNQKIQKLQKENNCFRAQLQLSKKNPKSHTRSQQLSQQTTAPNQQQLDIVKQHNQFLTNQNAKLSKACEKYMNQARQCTKLRLEIMKLREMLGKEKLY